MHTTTTSPPESRKVAFDLWELYGCLPQPVPRTDHTPPRLTHDPPHSTPIKSQARRNVVDKRLRARAMLNDGRASKATFHYSHTSGSNDVRTG
jgi:hypothetical protein